MLAKNVVVLFHYNNCDVQCTLDILRVVISCNAVFRESACQILEAKYF